MNKLSRAAAAASMAVAVSAGGWLVTGLASPATATFRQAAVECPDSLDRVGSARRVFATGQWINNGAVTVNGGEDSGSWTSTEPVSYLRVYAGTGNNALPPVTFDPPRSEGTWASDGTQHVNVVVFCGPGETSTPTPTTSTPTPTETTATPTPTETTPTPTETTATPTPTETTPTPTETTSTPSPTETSSTPTPTETTESPTPSATETSQSPSPSVTSPTPGTTVLPSTFGPTESETPAPIDVPESPGTDVSGGGENLPDTGASQIGLLTTVAGALLLGGTALLVATVASRRLRRSS